MKRILYFSELVVPYFLSQIRIYVSFRQGSDQTVLWDFFCTAGQKVVNGPKFLFPQTGSSKVLGSSLGHDRTAQ